MKPISEYNFREIVGRYVEIQTPDSIKEMVGGKDTVKAFCYIDQQTGISLRVIEDTNALIILRYNENYMVKPLEIHEIPIAEADSYHSDEGLTVEQRKLRNALILDPYRDNQFPDDVLINTYSNPPEEDMKSVWMRPTGVKENVIIATALENVDLIEEGDELCILPSDNGLIAMHFGLYKAILEEGEDSNEV
jgi:hypothetical protein